MTTQDDFHKLLAYFKVMANENRLRIAGLLADTEMSVGDLADVLDLREPTVSEHLSMMRDHNLVTVRADGTKRYYRLNAKTLYALNKELLSRTKLSELVNAGEPEDEETRVLNTYLRDGRLTRIPTGRKKLLIVLKWLAGHFEYDEHYSEKRVNKILGQFNEDFATLRRELVDFHFMARDKNVYWRVHREDAADAS
jgi:hypothetical protein